MNFRPSEARHGSQVSCNVFGVAALLELDRVSVADVLTLNKAPGARAGPWGGGRSPLATKTAGKSLCARLKWEILRPKWV